MTSHERIQIRTMLLVLERGVLTLYPRTTGTNSSVYCKQKTADLYRISATDLTVQRLFQERFGDPTSADM